MKNESKIKINDSEINKNNLSSNDSENYIQIYNDRRANSYHEYPTHSQTNQITHRNSRGESPKQKYAYYPISNDYAEVLSSRDSISKRYPSPPNNSKTLRSANNSPSDISSRRSFSSRKRSPNKILTEEELKKIEDETRDRKRYHFKRLRAKKKTQNWKSIFAGKTRDVDSTKPKKNRNKPTKPNKTYTQTEIELNSLSSLNRGRKHSLPHSLKIPYSKIDIGVGSTEELKDNEEYERNGRNEGANLKLKILS